MLGDEENEASATGRIVELGSGRTVGYLYAWEDGVKQPFWLDGEKSDVIVIEMSQREEATWETIDPSTPMQT